MQAIRTSNPRLWDETDGTHFFQIGRTLYFLDAKALGRSSTFLKNLIDGSGHAQHDPIKIPDIGEEEFEVFALRAYSIHINLPGYPDLVPLLRKLLHLGDYFLSSSTLNYVFDEIDKNQYKFTAPELIEFCYRYHTKQFASKSFERLIGDTFSSITLEDADKMGVTALLILAKTKENMHLHIHNVACNPPALQHADDCPNPDACDKDWRAAWWNQIGRFLMDAKNPLSWGEAVKRFQKTEFGQMGDQCREEILSRVTLGDGYFRGLTIRDDAMQKLLADIKEIDPQEGDD